MALVPFNDLLAATRSGGYAVCYCEALDLESLQAALEAAEGLGAPTIAWFNDSLPHHHTPHARGVELVPHPRELPIEVLQQAARLIGSAIALEQVRQCG
ncbi:MAG: hypothetical protein ACREP9_06000, partial [Candidatus Dormibacteraceae bacterium]